MRRKNCRSALKNERNAYFLLKAGKIPEKRVKKRKRGTESAGEKRKRRNAAFGADHKPALG